MLKIKQLLPRQSVYSVRLSRHVFQCMAAFVLGGLLSLPSVRADDFVDGTGAGKDAPANERPRTDKSQYNLFNPTPVDLMRDFSSSRPDQTTGPHSVDAGHFWNTTIRLSPAPVPPTPGR